MEAALSQNVSVSKVAFDSTSCPYGINPMFSNFPNYEWYLESTLPVYNVYYLGTQSYDFRVNLNELIMASQISRVYCNQKVTLGTEDSFDTTTGTVAYFSEGDYSDFTTLFTSIPPDTLSSLDIPYGVTVILYSGTNYSGSSIYYEGPTTINALSADSFDDMTQSMKITCNPYVSTEPDQFQKVYGGDGISYSFYDTYMCVTAAQRDAYIYNREDASYTAPDADQPAFQNSTFIAEDDNRPYFNLWPYPDEYLYWYDQRAEQYHSLGLTGPKDVIFIIDCSYSMQNKFSYVRAAVVKALNALTYYDTAQVIFFNTDSDLESYDTYLYYMNDTNKDALIAYVEDTSFEPKGYSDIWSALTLAWDIIEESMTWGDDTGCYGRGAILVFSDFHTDSYNTAAVQTMNVYRRWMIFQYALDNAHSTNSWRMAYDTDGAAWFISDYTQIGDYVLRYASYMAKGVYSQTGRYVEMVDTLTGVTSVRACKPMLKSDSARTEIIMGTTCVDSNLYYLYSDVQALSDYTSGFVNPYESQTAACPLYIQRHSEMNTARSQLGAMTFTYTGGTWDYRSSTATSIYNDFNTNFNTAYNLIESEYASLAATSYDTASCNGHDPCDSAKGWGYTDHTIEEIAYTTWDGSNTTEDDYFRCMANSFRETWYNYVNTKRMEFYRSMIMNQATSPQPDPNAHQFLYSALGPQLVHPADFSCSDYFDMTDYKPIAATYSGPKDIIFYIENSWHIGQLWPMRNRVYNYVEAILNTLTFNDRVTAVYVSSTVSKEYTTLQSVNFTTVKADILATISGLSFSSTSMVFNDGLTAVDEIIAASSTSCNGIVIALTAGMQGTQLETDIPTWTAALESSNPEWRVNAVSFGMCAKNAYLSQLLACGGRGLYDAAPLQEDVMTYASIYWRLLYWNSGTRWVDYTDAKGNFQIAKCKVLSSTDFDGSKYGLAFKTAVYCRDLSMTGNLQNNTVDTDYNIMDKSDWSSVFSSMQGEGSCTSGSTASYTSGELDTARAAIQGTDTCATAVTYSSDACTQCNTSTQFMNDAYTCLTKSIDNCNIYDPRSTSGNILCSLCDSGYVVSTDYSECTTTWTLYEDACFYPVYRCTTFDHDSGLCTECYSGNAFWFVENNLCKATNCGTYNSNYSCTSCDSGYLESTVSEPFCHLDITECSTYSTLTGASTTGFCLGCNSFFTLSNQICYADNCETYNSTGGCTACNPGYHVDSLRCFSNVKNCTNYDSITGDCDTCDTYYTLNSQECIPDYCNTYNNLYVCTICDSGFFLLGNNCAYTSNYCTTYDGTSLECTACDYGMTWDGTTNFTCMADNCTTHDSFNELCTACDAGYADYLGICYTEVTNCIAYDNSDVCITCDTGYTLDTTNNLCHVDIAYCAVYNADGTCSTCAFNMTYNGTSDLCEADNCNTDYLNADGSCDAACTSGKTYYGGVCFTTIEHCSVYNSSADLCADCDIGWIYHANTNECQREITYCTTYLDSGDCGTCDFGFSYTSPECYADNCTAYDPYFACLTCDTGSGYLLVNNICYTDVTNCTAYEAASDACATCDTGFTLDTINNQCPTTIVYCDIYNADETCGTCDFGFTYNGLSDLCEADNCTTLDTDGACTTCDAGYIEANNICYTDVTDCATYELASDACATCDAGYTLDAINNLCPCDFGYTWNGTSSLCEADKCETIDGSGDCTTCHTITKYNGACYTTVTDCATYDVTQDTCFYCDSGFTWDSTNLICHTTIAYCDTYAADGTCSTCELLFTWNGTDLCEADNCTTLDASGGCTACTSGTLDNNRCYTTVSDCATYDVLSDICELCDSGFDLDFTNNLCHTAISYCTTYASDGTCGTCDFGFTYNATSNLCEADNCVSLAADGACDICSITKYNGICYTAVIECSTYSISADTCETCNSGFTWDATNSICQITISYCSVYAADGTCSTCDFLFTWNGTDLCEADNCTTLDSSGGCTTCATGIEYGGACYTEVINCIVYDSASDICDTCENFHTYDATNNKCHNTLDYCSVYNSDGTCGTCDFGYTYNTSTILCEADNCSSLDGTGACNTCTAKTDYYACYTLVSNCATYNATSDTCATCDSGYTWDSTNLICHTTIDYCDVYNSNGTCNTCNFYFTLNGLTGKCEADNCTTMASNGGCTTCIAETAYGACYVSIDNCATYDSTADDCATCDSGYTWDSTNSVCQTTIDYCTTYASDGTCSSCQYGFTWNGTSGLCEADNCTTMASNGGCTTCTSGTADGACYTAVTNCATYDTTADDCATCSSGWTWDSTNSVCQTTIDYCTTYASDGTCGTCDWGFTYNATSNLCEADDCTTLDSTGACTTCTQVTEQGACYIIVANCATYDLTADTCSICDSGWTWDSTNLICHTTITYCTTYAADGTCSTCDWGFTWNGTSGLCEADNCTTQDANGGCTTCTSGTAQDACYTTVTNCSTYDTASDACVTCDSGFDLDTTNNLCHTAISYCTTYASDGTCGTCDFGFTYNSTTNLCEADDCSSHAADGACDICMYTEYSGVCFTSILYCATYDLGSDTCSTCDSTFTWDSGNTVCQTTIDYCTTYAADGSCGTCDFLFTWNGTSGLCEADNCTTLAADGACTTCTSGTLQNNVCYTTVSDCATYDLLSDICDTCDSGFTLDITNDLCHTTIDYCDTYNSDGTCGTCDFNFTLNGTATLCEADNCYDISDTGACTTCNTLTEYTGVCYITVYNCATYSSLSDICETCDAGYSLDTTNDMCHVSIIYCATYNADGTCATCDTGYSLYSNACYTTVTNCGVYNSTTLRCDSCNTGFDLEYDHQICYNAIMYCTSYNYDTTCATCGDLGYGFTYNGISDLCEADNCTSQDANGGCTACTTGVDYLGACYTPITNCDTYDTTADDCSTCVTGYSYEFTNTTCHVTIDYCTSYNADSTCNTCGVTGYGFTWNGTSGLCEADNCTTMDASGGCTSCSSGIDYLGACYTTLTNCATYLSYQDECETCDSGWTYDSGNTVCQTTIDYCDVYASDGTCTTCAFGFTWNGTSGLCEADNCTTLDTNGACLTCNATTEYLGVCYTTVSNCIEYDSTSDACITCSYYGYVQDLTNNLCHAEVTYCTAYDGSGCSTCDYGMTYNSTSGLCESDNCDTLDTDGSCTACSSGYSLQSLICYTTVTDCATYDTASDICDTCDSGFNLDSTNNVCYAIIPLCTVYESDYTCNTCDYTTGQYSICNELATCSYVDGSGNCIEPCSTGFLYNSVCYTPVPNCDVYSTTADECSSCITGYLYDATSAACYLEIVYCDVNAGDRTCTTCSFGYSPNATTYFCEADNCDTLSGDSDCGTCSTGYDLYNGICYTTVNNCSTYEAASDACATCDATYQLDSTNNACELIIANCATYNADWTCATCLSLFTLTSNVCEANNCATTDAEGKCTSGCDTGFSTEGDGCLQDACISFVNDACATCVANFSDNSGFCEADNCTTLNATDNDGTCDTCDTGYDLESGVCAGTLLYCTAYDVSTLDCTTCNTGFTPLTYNCYCDNYQYNMQYCVSCPSGYSDYNGLCYATVTSCSVYDTTDGLCTTCESDFTLNVQVCEADNCTTMATSGLCTTCDTGYTEQSGVCYSTITDCASYNRDGTCDYCSTGYVLTSNACPAYVESCATYDASGCTACNGRFTLSSQVCQANNCASLATDGLCNSCDGGYTRQTSDYACYTTVDYCAFYNASDNTCAYCSTNYSLYNQVCYEEILNCKEYSIASDGYTTLCDVCLGQYKKFYNHCESMFCANKTAGYSYFGEYYKICNTCGQESTMDYCIAYTGTEINDHNTGTECTTCASGYTLNDAFECFEDFPYCTAYDTSASVPGQPDCTTCPNSKELGRDDNNTGYYYWSNNYCVDKCNYSYQHLNLYDNCATSIGNCALHEMHSSNANSGTPGVKCNTCSDGYFLSKENLCVYKNITDCDIYNYATSESGYQECAYCARNQILIDDETSCYCPFGTFRNDWGYCVPETVEHCISYSTASPFNNPICTACRSNHWYLTEFNTCAKYNSVVYTQTATNYIQDDYFPEKLYYLENKIAELRSWITYFRSSIYYIFFAFIFFYVSYNLIFLGLVWKWCGYQWTNLQKVEPQTSLNADLIDYDYVEKMRDQRKEEKRLEDLLSKPRVWEYEESVDNDRKYAQEERDIEEEENKI